MYKLSSHSSNTKSKKSCIRHVKHSYFKNIPYNSKRTQLAQVKRNIKNKKLKSLRNRIYIVSAVVLTSSLLRRILP